MARFTETLTADGDSYIFRVKQNTKADFDSEVVPYQLSGTFSGATITLQACMDETASPNVYTPVVNGAFTAASADNLILSPDVLYKWVVSGSGSPLPSITATVTGQIKGA